MLFHPERLRIVQTLANAGDLTTQQIATRLPDIAPATLYRHLQRLTAAGIAVVAAERPVRGVVERTYTVTAETAVIGPEEFTRLGSDEQFRYFARFTGSLLDQYARVLAGDWRSEVGALGYHQYPLHLSDGEFAAFTRDISAVLRTYLGHEPAPGRRRRLVSIILMPDTSPGANDAT